MATKKTPGTALVPVRRNGGRPVKAEPSQVVATAAKSVAVESARWVARKPVERVPVLVAAGVYAGGAIAHAVDFNPLEIGLGAVSAAGIGYIVAHRRTGDDTLAPLAAGSIFAAGSWIAAAAHFGVLWGPYHLMTLTFLMLYFATYRVYRRNVAMVEKVEYREDQLDWNHRRESWGLPNSQIIRREETRLGEKLTINIMGTGKRASSFVNAGMEERIAALHKLPRSRVKIREGYSADRIVISIRYVDPWEKPIRHPLLDNEPEIELDEVADICDPIAIGQDPETGDPFEVTVFDPEEGANRVMVVGISGAGKTVLVNNLLERLTAADNTMVCCIDLAKGKEMRRFRAKGALGPSAIGKKERVKALKILQFAANTIRHRQDLSDETGEAVHVPRPGAPAIFLVLDEIDELFNANDRIAQAAASELSFLLSKGRSEAVGSILIGQRGTAKWMGGADVRANINVHILMKVDRKNEMLLAAGEIGLELPDMSKYGEGHAGVALVVEKGKGWKAGRSFKLRDLKDLDTLAEGRRPSDIEPGLKAALGDAWAKLAGGEYDADNAQPGGAAGRVQMDKTAPGPEPEPEPAPTNSGALNDWTGGGSYDDEDREADEPRDGEFDGESNLELLDRSLEESLPADLRTELEGTMNRTEENLRRAQKGIADAHEIQPPDAETLEALRRSAQARRQQDAAQTVIAPHHMAIIREMTGQEGGASAPEIAKALGIARNSMWRILNKLRVEGIAYSDPPKGPKARWFLTAPDDGHAG